MMFSVNEFQWQLRHILLGSNNESHAWHPKKGSNISSMGSTATKAITSPPTHSSFCRLQYSEESSLCRQTPDDHPMLSGVKLYLFVYPELPMVTRLPIHPSNSSSITRGTNTSYNIKMLGPGLPGKASMNGRTLLWPIMGQNEAKIWCTGNPSISTNLEVQPK
ncbi:hypothetical protein NE237_022158 [Protea cynaroides]|uniref:Uncharacterized protein n=1 Tax=Protea cynaroides TaxID=273540 RepID=A0A9Q0HAF0_9MAGN|nr:hypothetical protein NE237_022158 [Protea cynaroides]